MGGVLSFICLVQTHTCAHSYADTHIYVYIHTDIQTHTHTHTHTHTVPLLSNFAGAVLGTEAAAFGGFRFTLCEACTQLPALGGSVPRCSQSPLCSPAFARRNLVPCDGHILTRKRGEDFRGEPGLWVGMWVFPWLLPLQIPCKILLERGLRSAGRAPPDVFLLRPWWPVRRRQRFAR